MIIICLFLQFLTFSLYRNFDTTIGSGKYVHNGPRTWARADPAARP